MHSGMGVEGRGGGILSLLLLLEDSGELWIDGYIYGSGVEMCGERCGDVMRCEYGKRTEKGREMERTLGENLCPGEIGIETGIARKLVEKTVLGQVRA